MQREALPTRTSSWPARSRRSCCGGRRRAARSKGRPTSSCAPAIRGERRATPPGRAPTGAGRHRGSRRARPPPPPPREGPPVRPRRRPPSPHGGGRQAARYGRAGGADVIDIGCTPGRAYPDLGAVVGELVAAGMRVSIDSFDSGEIRAAVAAGAELVLSVNGSNLHTAGELAGTKARVVAIPDFGTGLETLEPTVAALERGGVPYLIDPIIQPIGFGFMASLDRLVTLKDPKILAYGEAELRALHRAVTDPNFRIFADEQVITVFNNEIFVRGTDINDLFAQLGVDEATHAFYLGRELMKAKIAITLGKTYRQEGQLQWGYLTPQEEPSRHVLLTQRSRRRRAGRPRTPRGAPPPGASSS